MPIWPTKHTGPLPFAFCYSVSPGNHRRWLATAGCRPAEGHRGTTSHDPAMEQTGPSQKQTQCVKYTGRCNTSWRLHCGILQECPNVTKSGVVQERNYQECWEEMVSQSSCRVGELLKSVHFYAELFKIWKGRSTLCIIYGIWLVARAFSSTA